MLWQLDNQKVEDYLFCHLERPNGNVKEQEILRKKILEQGDKGGQIQFLNYATLGNSSFHGSSSIEFVLSNKNRGTCFGGKNISLESVFYDLGYYQIYEKYQRELLELDREHSYLTKYGQLLLFGIPKDKIKNLVYLTHCGGQKRRIKIDGVGETDDIELIMKTLCNNPERIDNTDRLEFALIKTWDLALDPKSGVKVIAKNAVDPEKWKAFKAKEDVLWERMQADLEQCRKQNKQNQQQRWKKAEDAFWAKMQKYLGGL